MSVTATMSRKALPGNEETARANHSVVLLVLVMLDERAYEKTHVSRAVDTYYYFQHFLQNVAIGSNHVQTIINLRTHVR